MNYRQNQDVSWNLADAPATGSSSFSFFNTNVEDGSGWYPSPGLEEPFAQYGATSQTMDADMDVSQISRPTARPWLIFILVPGFPRNCYPVGFSNLSDC
jgi:hypothetical protein